MKLQSGTVFLLAEGPASDRIRPEHTKVLLRYVNGLHLAGAIALSQVHARPREIVSGNRIEHPRLPPSHELRNGCRITVTFFETPCDSQDAVRLRIGQRLQQDGVNNREYRRVRTNAKCQCERGHEGEPGTDAQDTK